MRRVLCTFLSFGLIAAACGSDSAENSAESDSVGVGGSQPESETGAADDGDGSTTSGGDGGSNPDLGSADFDYSSIDYDAEPVGNALFGDRQNDQFPPPVVPIDEIRSGGPPPDGIPPIDSPVFVSIEDATFMESNEEAVVAVTVNGVTKGYPIRIMTWHEIVNDVFIDGSGNETPVTVTYCPLCNSALAYDRRFGDRVLDFGTSGELYQSAMVMYDRQTQSLWSHFLGQGVVGHYAGAQLDFIPAQTLSWAAFKDAFPDGEVLDQNSTGWDRNYGANPYFGYDDEATSPFGMFVTREIDGRLADKARVIGIRDDESSLAIPYSLLAEEEVIAVTENGWDLVVFREEGLASALETGLVSDGTDVGQTGVFRAVAPDGTPLTFSKSESGFVDNETGSTWSITGAAVDGPLAGEQLEPFGHVDTFWFAWSIYQPATELRES